MMTTYFVTLFFFIFIRPQYAGRFIQWLSRRKLLRRWSETIHRTGTDFLIAATEMRRQPLRTHATVVLGTFGAWFLKFAMINCLILAVVPSTPLDGSTQMFIYARLTAMFIIMAFSPTPGGAGFAEVALANFISDFVPAGIGVVVALLWRGMAYYGYLLTGALVAPGWWEAVRRRNA
jgi:glycosyltransferase 2 family protein